MDSYLSAADKNTIFTDDLKTIVYIAETEAEYEITAKMFKRLVGAQFPCGLVWFAM